MSLPTPNELSKKARISYGLMVVIFGAGVYLGGVLTKVLGIDYHFKEELIGLRNDMEREVKLLRIEDEKINKRIDRKVINHEKIYHKDK